MSADEDLSGFSMLDLFRMEARQQARVLTDGLLLLERGGASPALLESMMRAAHSLKGAAAIVGQDAVVRLAHAIEDVFVAAQQGRLAIDGAGADTLLDGVDLMLHLAAPAAGTGAITAGGDGAAAHLDTLLAALEALPAAPVRAPAPAAPPAIAAAAPPVPPAAPAPEAPPLQVPPAAAGPAFDAGDELQALAGQARLHAGRLRPWIDSLQRYKRQQRSAWEALDRLQEALAAGADPRLLELAQLVAERARPLRDGLQQIILDAEHHERQAASVSARLVDEVRALRMCRFGEGVHGLPRMVRDLARSLGKDVQLLVEGADTLVDRAVLARIEGPLNQLLRNAVDHGMETPGERMGAAKPACGTIRLTARHRGGMLVIEVGDDGRGVDHERIRRAAVARKLAAPGFAPGLGQAELMEFLFLPGFSLKDSANEISGRGVGLDVVHETVRRLNGTVRAESRAGAGFPGFHVVITLPLTQSIVRALLVEVAGDNYALPIARVERVLRLARADVRTLSGREYVHLDGAHLGLVPAAQVLELGDSAPAESLAVIVIGSGQERYGLVVDDLCGEQSLSVQPLEPTFGKLRDVAAGALLDDGRPALILDVPDLLLSIARLLGEGASLRLGRADGPAAGSVRRVLVVDDSLTVREMQRKLLAGRGYRVEVALDGIDGWNSLRGAEYDLVITDIDMPRLDGIGLLGRIRQDPRLHRLPVMIVSYKDRPEDRARGLEAGADYYLAKGSFHDATLLDAVHDLIGPADGGAAA
jgi:two-component system sensor histidine kinase and response regulator WspE